MFIFIILNLLLFYLIQANHHWLVILRSEILINIGLFIGIIALLAGYFKKLPPNIWFDWVACSSLIIWYAWWYPSFRDGSPIFYFFPLYFALISAIAMFFFFKTDFYLDEDARQYLQWLINSGRIHPFLMGTFVLGSVFVTRHYTLYPVAITLFVLSYTITICLQE